MQLGKTLYVTNRNEWRHWLEKNYDKEREVWLIFPSRSSGKPRILYNDAVEEALCFGWIDSIVKKIDETSTAQRFSVRNPRSSYSQTNIERLKRLIKERKVIPSVLSALDKIITQKFVIPDDILKFIKSNKDAWENFKKFSPEYKNIRVGFIHGARNRPMEFKKRLNYFIKMTEKNKQYGYGGIEKYFQS
jgi:uncharacterized protein YdeI (YjbR/CyaY-like superfamily)